MESVYALNEAAEITDLYEAMATRVEKVHALIALALEEQLFNGAGDHHQYYLWVLSDIMVEIRQLSASLLRRIHQSD